MNNDPQMDMSGANPSAMSVYGQADGAEEFPVLKAFQQYIDAEQAKSRKRMLALSIFFSILMTAVIVIFGFVVYFFAARNQQLNDRYLEFVIKERDRQPLVVQNGIPQVQQSSADAAALKAVTDTLAALQKQIADQQAQKLADAARAAADAVAAAKQTAENPSAYRPSADEIARRRKIDSDAEKLKRATELLKAEKARLAKEKERLHQEQVEIHRRKLYPEYYAKKDREEAAAALSGIPVRSVEPVMDDPIEDDEEEELVPISYFDDDTVKKSVKPSTRKSVTKAKSSASKTDSRGVVNVDVNGSTTGWRVPLD